MFIWIILQRSSKFCCLSVWGPSFFFLLHCPPTHPLIGWIAGIALLLAHNEVSHNQMPSEVCAQFSLKMFYLDIQPPSHLLFKEQRNWRLNCLIQRGNISFWSSQWSDHFDYLDVKEWDLAQLLFFHQAFHRIQRKQKSYQFETTVRSPGTFPFQVLKYWAATGNSCACAVLASLQRAASVKGEKFLTQEIPGEQKKRLKNCKSHLSVFRGFTWPLTLFCPNSAPAAWVLSSHRDRISQQKCNFREVRMLFSFLNFP